MDPRPSPSAAVDAALRVTAEREPTIRAFAFLHEDRAREEARNAPAGPLSGITLGVKDIFDTADQPSEYGSAIFAGHRPRADAAVVAQLRAAGAVVLGKTVTAELAWVSPGPTANPWRTTHTPGGSSSGSAAAVAAGMADLAIGSQTAGSVIRPASFCGVLGMKATFGLLSTAGMKPAAPSLDTVGLMARDFDVLEAAWTAFAGLDSSAGDGDPAYALVRTDLWDGADDDCKDIVERAAARMGAAPRKLPEVFGGLASELQTVQAFEGARALAWELGYWRRHFLGCELLAAICATLIFTAWVELGHGMNTVNRFLSGQRSVTYGTIASLDGALLGFFIIATATIVLTFAPSDRFELLRGSPHYQTLWRTFTSTIRFLGLATLLALAALLGDRDTSPNRILMLLCGGSPLLAVIRLTRSPWALEKTIAVVTFQPGAAKQDAPAGP